MVFLSCTYLVKVGLIASTYSGSPITFYIALFLVDGSFFKDTDGTVSVCIL